jgi:hypothetical protein
MTNFEHIVLEKVVQNVFFIFLIMGHTSLKYPLITLKRKKFLRLNAGKKKGGGSGMTIKLAYDVNCGKKLSY